MSSACTLRGRMGEEVEGHSFLTLALDRGDGSITFTHWPLYLRGKSHSPPHKLLNKRLGGLEKNTEALVVASKEIGLEVNAAIRVTKHMVVSPDQNAGRSHSIKTDNSPFERCKYLVTTLTNQNSVQEEIKSRLKSENVCYHSPQNLFSSSLLSKSIKIKIYRTTILPVLLYGCEIWSLTLREEHSPRVSENRVLRRI